jgi:hypothetical protein
MQLAVKMNYFLLQNFKELVQLASEGDRRKVDQSTGDLNIKNRDDKDWYSLMPDDFTSFTLGKVAEESYDGNFGFIQRILVETFRLRS